MARKAGQATIEWVGVVLVVALALSATAAGAAGLAPGLARAVRCAVLAGCRGEDAALEAAYGADVAALVRAWAPGIVYEPGTLSLPVDFRTCRAHRCADAPDAPGRDVWRSRAGRRAAVFTHVVDRRGAGGALYLQFWLYYPDSTWLGPAYAVSRAPVVGGTPVGRLAGRAAGHHADDWESVQLRIGRDGTVMARASAHNGYAGRRRWPNLNELPWEPRLPAARDGRMRFDRRRRTGAWTPSTGWTRVSRGSHAGHIPPGPAPDERRTESDGLEVVPIETLAPADLATAFAISPPWRKPVYADPEATGT
ncbi:MAG: hypothetical protein QOE65_1627 [Solirubrobacteraceae bacterium]|jgi:hypothetical protein|nr:hypothetical protein [Solirubrobacteraceae bacterium]